MQQDAQGTLVEVMRGLQNVDATDRGAVISQLFGEEVKGAVAKLVTTLDDDKNGLVSAFAKVANQADRANSVNDEYANRAATRGHMLGQLSAKFDRMTIVLGDRLLPVLDAALPPLMTAIDYVADLAESSPELATGLMGVAAAIAVVKAGAIAFKLAKLTLGNGRDRFNLGKTKLTNSTDQTTQSANRASRSSTDSTAN
ncbi:phage tail tape measure protein [Marinomonas rhodophyticola]|uniref:Phage tail tape measure protein n=1 Tax=Marinomonas rhodophyticola TaxID=2992803 RepID=A0ABT3KGJ2_9GAMM|nr:phage tail tape measure protein [Marinomonas sp. KJ51-3]MCW4629666.1 phage tail tape measure protein [Marinomonas sp. KJ51-3]